MSSEYVNFGEHCLFVANLPQRLTNEQLAYSLIYIFHRFGQILSVKASRDLHGRPFGFVEFRTDLEVSRALLNCENLSLEGRKIRIELAKCQRKICVKTIIESNKTINDIVENMRNDFLIYSKPENIKINITNIHVIAIIKFNDVHKAEEAFKVYKLLFIARFGAGNGIPNGFTMINH
jgi:RNA recognition motif-containing protein